MAVAQVAHVDEGLTVDDAQSDALTEPHADRSNLAPTWLNFLVELHVWKVEEQLDGRLHAGLARDHGQALHPAPGGDRIVDREPDHPLEVLVEAGERVAWISPAASTGSSGSE